MRKNRLLAISFVLSFGLSQMALSSSKYYKKLKNQVDDYENSVIKDFDFQIPERYFSPKKQMELGILLEKKFMEQKKLFYHAEEGLFKIEDSLEEKVKKGLLSEKEANSLITSVEYARRIILHTRKSEVHSRYTEIKEKLSTKPTLKSLYKKFASIKLPGNCEIQNTHIDSIQGILNFQVKGKDPQGNSLVTEYSISQQEIDQGLFTSRYESAEHMGHKDKIIFRYNKTNPDESVSSFSLFENKAGEYYHAEFFQDNLKKPFLNFFGLFSIGTQTIDKETTCGKQRIPASNGKKANDLNAKNNQ